MGFKVTGIKEIDRALKGLEAKVAKKVLRQALRKEAKEIKKKVEQNSPVGETGEIHDEWQIGPGKRSRNTISYYVYEKAKPGATADAAEDGVNPYHTAFQEFLEGPNQGFVRRTFDETAEGSKNNAIDSIRKGIEREASK
jgi:hypothetical protein